MNLNLKALTWIGCLTLFALTSFAQQETAKSLANMEKEFSDYTGENGSPQAWTKFFAPDGIMFAPQPVNAIEFMKPRLNANRPKVNRLQWEAHFTDISSAGDMGYNIGPSIGENIKYDTVPKRYGYIFSVWKKIDDNTWRVALDAGISVKDKTEDHTLTGKFSSPPPVPAGTLKYSFLDAVTTFTNTAAEHGFTKAYAETLMDEAQMLKNEWALVKGKKAILAWMETAKKSDSDKAELKLLGSGVSKSNDLGFAYGSYRVYATNEVGIYVHVWKRINSEWKLVVDVTGPTPTGN